MFLGCCRAGGISPAQQPIIPPSVSSISPAGMERGSTAAFTIEGRNLANASDVIFDSSVMSGKVTRAADIPEKIAGPRADKDFGARVPLGTKQTAELEVKVSKDAVIGVHRFRIETPLGTTNTVVFAGGMLSEIPEGGRTIPESAPQLIALPATLIGSITAPGEKDSYDFDPKAGQNVVFQVQASMLGSKVISMLVSSDSLGKMLAEAGWTMNAPTRYSFIQLPGMIGTQYRFPTVTRVAAPTILSTELRAVAFHVQRISARCSCRGACGSIRDGSESEWCSRSYN
jgi:hypothetical protein